MATERDATSIAPDPAPSDQDPAGLPGDAMGPSSEVATVGPREGLAAGVIGLGVLAVAMPFVVDQLPSVAEGGSAAYVLYGMSVMIGLFVILAGVMSFFIRD